MTLREREEYYRKYLNKVIDEMVSTSSGLEAVIKQNLTKLIDISLQYSRLGKSFQFEANRNLEESINEITEQLRTDIFNYIYLQCEEADKIAQESNGVKVDNSKALLIFLSTKIADLTLDNRIEAHVLKMTSEIEAYVAAGIYKGLNRSQILSAYMFNIKKPYLAPLLLEAFKEGGFKAERISSKGLTLGKGKYIAAFNDLKRTARDNIFGAYGQMQQRIWERDSEYVGWTTYRGSSYPCEVCDMEAGRFHSKSESYYGYHVGCVCIPIPVYKSDLVKK